VVPLGKLGGPFGAADGGDNVRRIGAAFDQPGKDCLVH
jgi:hypothetical protein